MKGRSAPTTPLTIVVFASAATGQFCNGSVLLRLLFCAFKKLDRWPQSQPHGNVYKLVPTYNLLSSIPMFQCRLALCIVAINSDSSPVGCIHSPYLWGVMGSCVKFGRLRPLTIPGHVGILSIEENASCLCRAMILESYMRIGRHCHRLQSLEAERFKYNSAIILQE
jgi:hypothetical protein